MTHRVILLLVVVVLLIAACSNGAETTDTTAPTTTTAATTTSTTTTVPASPTLHDQLLGTWVTLANVYVVFNEDDTFGVGHSPALATGTDDVEPEIEWGTWYVEGNTLIFDTSSESETCAGVVGTYDIEIVDDGGQMSVSLVDDTCGPRGDDFSDGLTRVG